MIQPRKAAFLLALGGLVVVSAAPRETSACAVAVRGEATIETASESALIIWDDAKKREHFIRGATFAGSAREAAFLVPTPSLPELAAVEHDPFAAINRRAEPAHETVSEWGVSLMPICLALTLTRSDSKSASVRAGVEVVATQRVGNYDATILKGTSAEAITTWLAQHELPARPALLSWLAPYVERGFYFTAFRLAEDPTQGGLAATTVRLSFDTSQPFYPYREPDDAAPHPGRLLRLTVVSSGTPQARVGDKPWLAPLFAGELGPVADVLPVPAPERPWLTVFEDRVDTRRGLGDLTFMPTVGRKPIVPPPIIDTVERRFPLPLDVIVVAGLLGGLGVWAGRRARAVDQPAS